MSAPFKAKLSRGECVIIINVDHPSPSLVETICRLPIDAVFFDCEQGSPDIESIENMARAARLTDTTSLVRLFDRSDWVIERYMGRGVDGIVVPRLENTEQAAAVVDAVRYCFPQSHQDKVIVIQIETRSALAELDAFIAQPGIDVLFLGPVDLAKSFGFAGDHRHPEVQRMLIDAITRIRRAGKAPGILVDRANIGRWVEAGALFLYQHTNDLLAMGAEQIAGMVTAAKRQSSAPP